MSDHHERDRRRNPERQIHRDAQQHQGDDRQHDQGEGHRSGASISREPGAAGGAGATNWAAY